MHLIRLIIILVLVWLVYQLIRRYLLPPRRASRRVSRSGTMVRCAHCGLHVPEQEALQAGERYYCSREHLELEDRRPR